MAFSDKKAATKYVNEHKKEHYDKITVLAKKGSKEKYKKEADARGLSLSAFIIKCIEKELLEKI